MRYYYVPDLLTGLHTRRDFEEYLKTTIDRAKNTYTPISLAMLDIDHFKRFNDEYGHQAGDVIIKGVAQLITETVGDSVFVARYGGEEFTLIFQNMEREQAFLIVEQIRSRVEKTTSFKDGDSLVETSVTISGGIAAYPIDGEDDNALFRKSDGALYHAKSTGRNKITLAFEERMAPKTAHFTLTQLSRLSELAKEQGVGEAVLLREALDDLLVKYKHRFNP